VLLLTRSKQAVSTVYFISDIFEASTHSKADTGLMSTRDATLTSHMTSYMDAPLYESYAQVLAVCHPIKDDLEALLDPQTGFAPRLRQICTDQYVLTLNLDNGADAL
jgi:hypothetical protein